MLGGNLENGQLPEANVLLVQRRTIDKSKGADQIMGYFVNKARLSLNQLKVIIQQVAWQANVWNVQIKSAKEC